MKIILLTYLGYVASTAYKSKCPDSVASCVDDDNTSQFILNSKVPKCWKQEGSTWRCKGYIAVKNRYTASGTCPLGYSDVFLNCDLKNPSQPGKPTEPTNCPANVDQCYKEGKYISFVDKDIPSCWRRAGILSAKDLPENFPNEANIWQCQDSKADNTCPPNFLNVNSCHSKVEKQCPVGFKLKECYDSGDQPIGVDSNLRNQYACWKRHESLKDAYRCAIKANGKCLENEVDISECEVGLKCPTSNEKCDLDGNQFFANQPNTPKCWSDTPLGWNCTNKVEGKCNFESIDIETCEITKKVECPKRDAKCTSNNQSFGIYTNSTRPRCWFPGSNGEYSCRSIDDDASCTEKEVDISICYPKLPKCPNEYTSTCLLKSKSKVVNLASKFDTIDDEVKVLAGDPGENLCWSRDEAGDWHCQPKTKGYCEPGHLNLVRNCPQLQFSKPSEQACPPNYFTACINNRKVQLAGEVKVDVCFSQQPGGNWLCKPKVNGKCSADSVDVSTCSLKLPSRPECPKTSDTKCKLGSAFILAGKPDKRKCWSPSSDGGWKCRSPIDPKVGCRVDSVDVTQCKFPKETKPICPATFFTKCGNQNNVFAGLSNDYSCWSTPDSGVSWSCYKPTYGKCASDQLDLSTCTFDLPEASLCPTLEELEITKCDYQGQTLYYKDNHPDTCWLADSTKWLCMDKVNGVCPLGTLNNSECKKSVQRPKCPVPEAICSFKHNLYTPDKSLDRPCWVPLSRNFPATIWSCQPRDPTTNKCLNSIDVTDCDKPDTVDLALKDSVTEEHKLPSSVTSPEEQENPLLGIGILIA